MKMKIVTTIFDPIKVINENSEINSLLLIYSHERTLIPLYLKINFLKNKLFSKYYTVRLIT